MTPPPEQPESIGYGKFLDRNLQPEERAKALSEALSAGSEDEIHGLGFVALNPDEPATVRGPALTRLTGEAPNKPEAVDAVLSILGNAKEPEELRVTALDSLRVLFFNSKLIREERPRYLDTLRSVIDDPSETLRTGALDILAKNGDPIARERLVSQLGASLRPKGAEALPGEEAKAAVPVEKAIQLLGYDKHADLYPMLRKVVEESPNEAAKLEAVRVLSSDPRSTEFLANIYGDKSGSPDVRAACGVALRSLSPTLYEKTAKEVAVDSSAPAELRAASLTGLEHFGNRAALIQDKTFSKKLKESLDAGAGPTLERALKSYQAKIPAE